MTASPPETQASLILRLQNADDAEAWAEFPDLYGPVVYRAARTRGFQEADALDLVQEVWVAVAESVSQWLDRTDRGSFRVWLLSLTRNHAVDLLTRRATRSLGEDGDQAARKLSEVPVVEEISTLIDLENEQAVFRWAAAKVQESVAEHAWQAFWLTHVDGLSVEQAAEQLRTKPGNIYFGRSRVLARIRKLVMQYEDYHA